MAYTSYTCVKAESSGQIVTVIIDNPPFNLITRDLLDELGETRDGEKRLGEVLAGVIREERR